MMLDLRSLVPWGHKSNEPAATKASQEPIALFRHEMDRLFDNFFNGFGSFGTALAGNGKDVWTGLGPALDVKDTDKELVITAELPGVDEKDFDVTLVGDLLTIKGEKKHEHEEKNGEREYIERSYGAFSRTVRLPFEAGDQDVEAKFDKGVLTLTIPKPATLVESVKHITVKKAA